MADDQIEKRRRLESAIEKGSQLVGSLVGNAVGLAGGAEAAIGGAAAGWATTEALQRVGIEVLSRVTGHEAVRVGAVGFVIEADASERRHRGEQERQDDFFHAAHDQRAPNEQLLEGLLRYAAETYQEQKLPYMAHLYDAASYDTSISPDMSVYLLKLSNDLTYRQLLALAAYADRDREDSLFLQLLRDGMLEQPRVADPSVQGEIRSLLAHDLVYEHVDQARSASRRFVITSLGSRLARAMRLELLPADEVRRWVATEAGRPT